MEHKEIITFGLLENGLDFVKSAVNYLVGYSEKSDLKYGILHLSAGIELILKYRLSKEHWSLVFQNFDKVNKGKLESGDFASVDYETTIKRLKEICFVEISPEYLADIKNLRDKRNRMEHFSITDSPEAIKVSFVKVLNFVLDFIKEHISEDDLGESGWETLDEIRGSLGDFEDFIRHRWEVIDSEIEENKKCTSVTYCPVCFQGALVIDDGGHCLFCNHTNHDGEELARNFISEILGIDEYSTVKDGGEYPLYYCFDCGKESLVDASDDEDIEGWICLTCGIEYDSDDIEFCETCGTPFIADEHSIGMCNSCIEHRMRD